MYIGFESYEQIYVDQDIFVWLLHGCATLFLHTSVTFVGVLLITEEREANCRDKLYYEIKVKKQT